MDGRKELLSYMGTATVTLVGLFVLQIWYGSYLDVSHHAEWHDAPMNADLKTVRGQEAQKQGSIDKAKEVLGQRGRRGVPKLAPQQSQDLGAMSGWIHAKGFKPYEPRQAAAPEPDPTEAAVPEGHEGAQGAEEGTEAAAAEGAEAPAAAEQPAAEGAEAAAPAGEGAPAEAAPAEEK